MNIVLRLAWRNLWRHARRTWLTIGAMVFSNMLLVFMISLQFSMYGLMIDNTLKVFTGHMQVQAPGYNDDQKMRQVVPGVQALAERLRAELDNDDIAARGWAFALASSECDGTCHRAWSRRPFADTTRPTCRSSTWVWRPTCHPSKRLSLPSR